MNKLYVAIVLMLWYNLCQAQTTHTGILQGVVQSAAGELLAGAHVRVDGQSEGAYTDARGAFYISLAAGEHTLEISYVGYESQQHNVQITEGQTQRLAITLIAGPVQLSDITVQGSAAHSLNAISQVDIQLRPVNTSQDVLRIVPGLFIAQHAGGGKAEQIFLRGFDVDHGTDINLSVDGIPVNMVSHAHGQGYSDLHFLIPEVIQYVDFNKGPYYADKGDFTTAGYAAFQTKNKLDENMVKLEGGRFGTVRNVIALNVLNRKRQSLYLASELFHTDGYFDAPQDFNRVNVTGKYVYSAKNGSQLVAGLSTFSSAWDASGQIPWRAVKEGLISRFGSLDNTEGGETARTNGYIRYTHNVAPRSYIEHQAYYSHYHFLLYSNFTFYLNDPEHGDQIRQSEDRNLYGYTGRFFNHTNALGGMLNTEAGIGTRWDFVNDIRLSHTEKRKTFIGDVARGDVTEGSMFAYLSETLTLNKLSINGSVRMDYFRFAYDNFLTGENQDDDKVVMSPKVNVQYEVTPNTLFFIRAGEGFHSNDARVVVAENGYKTLPKAYGLDVGTTGKWMPGLLVSTSLWMLDLDQEFVYVGDEGVVEPGGKTRRMGVDFSARYQVTDWLFADVDVNLAHARSREDPEGEDYIPLAPRFTSIGGLTVKNDGGFSGSLRYRYMHDRPANEDDSAVAKGYFLLDATARYDVKRLAFTLTIENLLDTDWEEAQFYTESQMKNETEPVSEIHFTPGTPFSFRAGVSVYF